MRTSNYDIDEVRELLGLRDAEGLTFKQTSERSGVPVHVLTYRAKQDGLDRSVEAIGSTGVRRGDRGELGRRAAVIGHFLRHRAATARRPARATRAAL